MHDDDLEDDDPDVLFATGGTAPVDPCLECGATDWLDLDTGWMCADCGAICDP